MRKAILLFFLIIGLLCVAVLYGPAVSLISDAMANPSLEDLPPSLQEDIAHLLSNEAPQLTVSFSHQGFFYNETISVSISTNNPDAAIYYTTDGSTPTEASERYVGPLEFTAEEVVKCNVLKAIATDETQQSSMLTHSYFVGTPVYERFHSYVFSISTDDDNLYGHENGILIPGILYEEYRAKNPDRRPPEPSSWRNPANYNVRGRISERPVHIEVLTNGGERIIAQNAGMRVNGTSSRIRAQKSLRLIARREYEPRAGKFAYPFFEDYRSFDDYQMPVLSYDTLILGSSANDNNLGRIRTHLASRIAQDAGYPTVSPQSAAAVFLNGEYYASAWLYAHINEQFLEDIFRAPQRSFDIVHGGNHYVSGPGATEEIINEFDQLLEAARQGNIEAIERAFDIDDLLLYYALGVYTAADDWPQTNTKIWRYTGPFDTDSLAKELDGRWRFIFYDADASLNYSSGSGPHVNSILRLIHEEEESPVPEPTRPTPRPVILHALLKHREYAEKFANYLCDLAFEHASSANVDRLMRELNDMSLFEVEYSTMHGVNAGGRTFDEILKHRERISAFTDQRLDYILAEMRELFGYTDMYRVVSDGTVKINTLNGNEGAYFVENCVPVTPILEKGHMFDHYLINGRKHYDEKLLISIHDADADGVVHISLVSREDFPPLLFKDTYDTGTLFGFTMYNPNSRAQSTQGFYLSDDIDELKKWQFPNLNIRPGSTWEFVGRNSTSIDSLLKIGLNFNPRHGEVIFLSNEDGVILDYIAMLP